MSAVLQTHLPAASIAMLKQAKLPGIAPLIRADWLQVDEAYGGQMTLRDHLIATVPHKVHAISPQAQPAAQELLEVVLQDLRQRPDFTVENHQVLRPDGAVVPVDFNTPLISLARLVQEDFCLLQKQGDEHVLTGAILCFPASWTLAEKFMQPLLGIHRPVAEYDVNMAKRVQRLFDGVQPERPLWRVNGMLYDDPNLFSPRKEGDFRRISSAGGKYFRSERQSVLRLRESRAVVFSVHSYMVEIAGMSLETQQSLKIPPSA